MIGSQKGESAFLKQEDFRDFHKPMPIVKDNRVIHEVSPVPGRIARRELIHKNGILGTSCTRFGSGILILPNTAKAGSRLATEASESTTASWP